MLQSITGDWSWTPGVVNEPRFSGDILLCINPYHSAIWGLAFEVAHDNSNKRALFLRGSVISTQHKLKRLELH